MSWEEYDQCWTLRVNIMQPVQVQRLKTDDTIHTLTDSLSRSFTLLFFQRKVKLALKHKGGTSATAEPEWEQNLSSPWGYPYGTMENQEYHWKQ